MTSPFDRHVSAIKRLELKALKKLIGHFGSHHATAKALNMTTPAVNLMMIRGKVGRYAALTIDADPKIPFRLEDLRSDYEDLRHLTVETKPKARPIKK
jgi:hypothetical protein